MKTTSATKLSTKQKVTVAVCSIVIFAAAAVIGTSGMGNSKNPFPFKSEKKNGAGLQPSPVGTLIPNNKPGLRVVISPQTPSGVAVAGQARELGRFYFQDTDPTTDFDITVSGLTISYDTTVPASSIGATNWRLEDRTNPGVSLAGNGQVNTTNKKIVFSNFSILVPPSMRELVLKGTVMGSSNQIFRAKINAKTDITTNARVESTFPLYFGTLVY